MNDAMKTPIGTAAPTSASVPVAPLAALPIQDRLRSNNFDGLRLLFAAMVLVYHVALLSQAPEIVWFYRYISSGFAVQAFFVVSGFLVTMSYENTNSLVDYGRKRAFRIAPAYIAVVLIAAFSLSAVSSLSPSLYFADPEWRSYVGSNLILSNFKQPTLPGVFTNNFEPAVNGSLWTIKLEVMFYCTVPIIVWATRRFGYKPVLALLFLLSITWQATFLYISAVHASDLAARLAKQLPGQLAFFGGGAFAYYRTRDGLSPPPVWIAALGGLTYALAQDLTFTIVAPFCVTAIVYWASIRVPQLWSARRWGDFSYGLYLYHFPIAQVMVALGAFAMAPILSLLCVCVLALGASITSWHLIEKRALRLVHRKARPDVVHV